MSQIVLLTVMVAVIGIASPFAGDRLRRAIRARRAHACRTRHWYSNFNEKLEYEPVHDRDIQKIFEMELTAKGYQPTGVTHRIPRTFRAKVPGDETIELWTAPASEHPPVWICCR
jgi:hypothetical protein